MNAPVPPPPPPPPPPPREPVPAAQPPAPEPSPRSRRPLKVALVALAAVVALVAAGAAVLVLRAPDEQVVAGQLLNTYPEQPTSAWSLDADDIVPGTEFSALEAAYGTFAHADFADLGDVLLTALRTGTNGQSHLVAVNESDGSVRWVVQIDGQFNCASESVDGVIPCIVRHSRSLEESELHYYRVSDGGIEQVQSRGSLWLVEASQGSVYLAGNDDDGRSFLSKGSVADPTGEWKATFDTVENCIIGGDSHGMEVKDGIVRWWRAAVDYAAHVDTGEPLSRQEVNGFLHVPGRGFVMRPCGDNPMDLSKTFVSYDGNTRFDIGEAVSVDYWMNPKNPEQLAITAYSAYDPETGEEVWRIPEDEALSMLIGNIGLGYHDGMLTARRLDTGETLWSRQHAVLVHSRARMSDGERLIIGTDDNRLASIDLFTGEREWQVSQPGEHLLWAAPAGEGFGVLTDTTLSYYPPTGVPSGAPGRIPEPESVDDGEGDLVTKCGSTPEMRPVSYRTDDGSLVVTMDITATCPSGDVLSSDAMRISISDTGGNIASGMFDFSSSPIAVPRNDGSPRSSVQRDLTFTPDSYWRLPNSLGTSTDLVSSTAAGDQLVACEDEGVSATTSARVSESSRTDTAPIVAVDSAAPTTGGNSEENALDALRAQAAADRPFVRSDLADRWVAQISAKRLGLDAPDIDGTPVHWSAEEILRQHLELRIEYPEVRLLWSDEWSTFDLNGWWVTVAGATFDTPDAANGWCDARRIPVDECFAKLVSSTRGSEGTTRYRR